MIRADYSMETDLILSASESGFVFVWNKIFIKNNKPQTKNSEFECFRPFEKDTSQYATFVPESTKNYYLKKVCNVTNTAVVRNIFVCSSKEGKICVVVDLENVSTENTEK